MMQLLIVEYQAKLAYSQDPHRILLDITINARTPIYVCSVIITLTTSVKLQNTEGCEYL